MKKVFMAFFALTLTVGVFAQDSTKMAPKEDHIGVMMRNGKVILMKDGQVSTLSDNLLLDNGTTVMSNGTAKTTDGKIITMQEGDYFKMDGTKGNMKMPMKKTDDMDKMKKDSTK